MIVNENVSILLTCISILVCFDTVDWWYRGLTELFIIRPQEFLVLRYLVITNIVLYIFPNASYLMFIDIFISVYLSFPCNSSIVAYHVNHSAIVFKKPCVVVNFLLLKSTVKVKSFLHHLSISDDCASNVSPSNVSPSNVSPNSSQFDWRQRQYWIEPEHSYLYRILWILMRKFVRVNRYVGEKEIIYFPLLEGCTH